MPSFNPKSHAGTEARSARISLFTRPKRSPETHPASAFLPPASVQASSAAGRIPGRSAPASGHDFSRIPSAYSGAGNLPTNIAAGKAVNPGERRSAGSPVLHLQRQPAGGQAMPQGNVQPASAEMRREFAREALMFLRGQGEHFALQSGRDLASQLADLRTTVQNGLAAIAGDASAANLQAGLRTAYRDAVRMTLLARTRVRPGQQAAGNLPTLQELYEQQRDNIFEYGLPQASVDAGSAELSAELTAALPAGATPAQTRRHAAIQNARQRLQVITAPVDFTINDLFSTAGGRTTINLPAGMAARFSSTIPAALQPGLRNVAGNLMRGTAILAANTTVQLALDLTPFGGSYDAYRFTRLDLGQQGSEVLIERQGAIGVEGLRREQRVTLQQRFDRLGFRRGRGFNDDQFDQVLIGVAEVPESQLGPLQNLRFERTADDPNHPDDAGHYDQAAHTVRLFDRAFGGGQMRLGRAGRVLTFAAHAVVHELGHALDLHPLRTTAAATEAAEANLLGEFGTGDSGYTIPDPRDPARRRYDELQSAIATARRAETAARARSGARWSGGTTSTVIDTLASNARQPAFRAAAIRDGGAAGQQMPTTYPNPDSFWQEYFAESFALYQTAPQVLQRLRPNVYSYMQTEFPR